MIFQLLGDLCSEVFNLFWCINILNAKRLCFEVFNYWDSSGGDSLKYVLTFTLNLSICRNLMLKLHSYSTARLSWKIKWEKNPYHYTNSFSMVWREMINATETLNYLKVSLWKFEQWIPMTPQTSFRSWDQSPRRCKVCFLQL